MSECGLYLHDTPSALRFAVSGVLDAPLAEELLASAATSESIREGRPIVIDLRAASGIDADAASVIARLAEPHIRFLTREQHVAPLAGIVSRTAQPAPEPRRPWLLRRWCALLQWLRPGCACPACHSGRVWSL